MDELTQALLSQIRSIMQGKNAPESLRINTDVEVLRGGAFVYATGHGNKITEPILLVTDDDLRAAMAQLKTRQVINAEKRIDRLQRRKELDERLLALLREYEQD